jgi:hypothetical protein
MGLNGMGKRGNMAVAGSPANLPRHARRKQQYAIMRNRFACVMPELGQSMVTRMTVQKSCLRLEMDNQPTGKMKTYLCCSIFALLAAWRCAAAEVTTNVWGPVTNNVKMSIMVKAVTWTFSNDDILDLTRLVARLRGQADPVSTFVWQSLSARRQLLLMNYQPSAPSSTQCGEIVLQALNRIVEGPYFGLPEEVKGILLRDETMGLMHRNVEGPDLAHLNRSMLQYAYPVELSGRLKAGDTTMKGTDEVVLTVVFSNISTNETFRIDTSGMIYDRLCSFQVLSPSGKELSPQTLPSTIRRRVSYALGPNRTQRLALPMSAILKFDEIGAYTITARRILWWPGGKQEWFTVVSNPLSIKIVPDIQ